jgi:ferrous iron transport protein A
MMPLGLLGTGEKAEVTEIIEQVHKGGVDIRCPETCKSNCAGRLCRVEEMGLRAGKVVEMLNNEGRGAMLIKIDETRIALSRGVAMKIMVRRKD